MSRTWTRSVGRQLPVQVVEVERAVRADLEPVAAEPGDGPVAADAARLVERERVGDGADALVHLPGGQAVEQGQRTGAADLEALERGHVVHARPPRGCATPRRPRSASGTARTRRRAAGGVHSAGRSASSAALASYQCGRSQPAPSRKTAPSSSWRPWNGLTRRLRGESLRLQRVQHVVDLDEVLRGGLLDVVRGALELLEAVHVAAVQVVLGPAVDQQLGDGLGDAGGVGHPDGLGDPEAGDVRRTPRSAARRRG